jgi:hypothetical protein
MAQNVLTYHNDNARTGQGALYAIAISKDNSGTLQAQGTGVR